MQARTRKVLSLVLVTFLAAAPVASAQTNRCAFMKIPETQWGPREYRAAPEERSVKGALQTTLTVRYTDPNTTTIGGCGVKLRSYNGQLVGPTLRVRAGDVMNILLDNRLPVETPDEVAEQLAQEYDNAFIETRPHTFNTTNLHTHGLHVSPVGNSDNVLIAVAPQTKFPYEIKVPENHPPGTFWYHAHAHGSTAVQVGSGMAGALIIEDDPAKIPASLAAANKNDKVMVIQTTLYDAQGEIKDITAFFPDPSGGPNPACAKQLPSCTWQSSQRRVTINGQIVPKITMRPGEVQRWRLIDASFRESFNLRLTGHVLNEIALDGLYLGYVDEWGAGYTDTPTKDFPVGQTVELQPGYRSDVLVQASMKPGVYYLVDVPTPATVGPAPPPCPLQATNAAAQKKATAKGRLARNLSAPKEGAAEADKILTAAGATVSGQVRTSLLGVPEDENILAEIHVQGEPVSMKLPTDAEMKPLAPFPGVDLKQQAVGVQVVEFKLGSPYNPPDPDNPNNPINNKTYFQVNGRAFSPTHIRYVSLNNTDMWALTTVGDPPCSPAAGGGIPPLPHVFHIHVNPFQSTRLGPDGQIETVWKDTLLVPPAANLQIFTQYLDYIGQFVMHCHILDHEDLGMMEVVEVVGDRPAATLPTHSGHH